jgi:methylmalonyl-CoA mutase, N-terminal domain
MYFAKEVLSQSSELKKKWEDEVRKVVSKVPDQKARWSTVSDLEIRRLYGPDDIKDMDFVRDIGYPGQFPYLRGNQATGYRGRFWTFRMFSGMGSAEETNKRWHMLLKEGQTGLSTAFDYATAQAADAGRGAAADAARLDNRPGSGGGGSSGPGASVSAAADRAAPGQERLDRVGTRL